MGILKVLGSIAKAVAKSPIPEYVALIGSMVKVASIVDACNITPKETKIVWDDNVPYTEEIPKVTPGDVWKNLHPVYGDISFRKAKEKYNKMDFDGKVTFVEEAIVAGCGIFYVSCSIARLVMLWKAESKNHSIDLAYEYLRMYMKDTAQNMEDASNRIMSENNECVLENGMLNVEAYARYTTLQAQMSNIRDALSIAATIRG